MNEKKNPEIRLINDSACTILGTCLYGLGVFGSVGFLLWCLVWHLLHIYVMD